MLDTIRGEGLNVGHAMCLDCEPCQNDKWLSEMEKDVFAPEFVDYIGYL
jgi:hypothetical protein